MTEAERLKRLEAVQLELFAISKQQEQLRLKFQDLQKSRAGLTRRVSELRRYIKRLLPPATKKCRKCGAELLASEFFYPDDRYADGRYPYCKFCKSEMSKGRKAA